MGGRKVISEKHIQDAVKEGKNSILAPPNALVTPLARDAARASGITISFGSDSSGALSSGSLHQGSASQAANQATPNAHLVCIGADHGGFELKLELIAHLKSLGKEVIDLGTDSTKSCDYPDFAYAVARLVADGKAGAGIMIDGVGVGSSIVCNKVPGIRAACAYNEFAAWNARAHNNSNVLTLGSRSMGVEVVKRIVEVFLATEFEGGRHSRRVQKMTDIEERFSRK